MSDVKAQVKARFEGPTLTVLATITETGAPWARYVMCTADEDLNLRFATHSCSRKVAQIKIDPTVHLTGGVDSLESAESWYQIAGQAEILDDPEEKQAFWNPGLEQFFKGPEDPNYYVIKIVPEKIEFATMASMDVEVWEA